MRVERIHLLMFAVSSVIALIYLGNDTVPGWKAAMIIAGHGVMFLLLGVQTKSQVEHQRKFGG